MNFNPSLPPPPPTARAANLSLAAAVGTAAPFPSSVGSAKQHPHLHLHPPPDACGAALQPCPLPCQWAAMVCTHGTNFNFTGGDGCASKEGISL